MGGVEGLLRVVRGQEETQSVLIPVHCNETQMSHNAMKHRVPYPQSEVHYRGLHAAQQSWEAGFGDLDPLLLQQTVQHKRERMSRNAMKHRSQYPLYFHLSSSHSSVMGGQFLGIYS